jgi:TATA-binding protein-associated factor Taf7
MSTYQTMNDLIKASDAAQNSEMPSSRQIDNDNKVTVQISTTETPPSETNTQPLPTLNELFRMISNSQELPFEVFSQMDEKSQKRALKRLRKLNRIIDNEDTDDEDNDDEDNDDEDDEDDDDTEEDSEEEDEDIAWETLLYIAKSHRNMTKAFNRLLQES